MTIPPWATRFVLHLHVQAKVLEILQPFLLREDGTEWQVRGWAHWLGNPQVEKVVYKYSAEARRLVLGAKPGVVWCDRLQAKASAADPVQLARELAEAITAVETMYRKEGAPHASP